MNSKNLIAKLSSYFPQSKVEQDFKSSFLEFVHTYDNCFERTLRIGHITGSAWIVNQSFDKALLTHHKKLNRWLQLGGHADGESDVLKVSTKEAIEESGLSSLKPHSLEIFDIDIHTIPARGVEPEHLHYDIRFLFVADDMEELQISSESKDLAWINIEDLAKLTENNESISRMAKKSMALFAGNKQ